MKERETPKITKDMEPEVAFILGYLEGIGDTKNISEDVLKKAGKMVKEYLEKREGMK